MISIMPEYAPSTDDVKYHIKIADQITTDFSEEDALEYLHEATAEILYTITELFAPLVAPDNVLDHIDVNMLMKHVVVTKQDKETISQHLTNTLHNLIIHHINLLQTGQL